MEFALKIRKAFCFRFILQKSLDKSRIIMYNDMRPQGYSSVGRVLVSKTMGRGFESFCPCQKLSRVSAGVLLFRSSSLRLSLFREFLEKHGLERIFPFRKIRVLRRLGNIVKTRAHSSLRFSLFPSGVSPRLPPAPAKCSGL